MGWEGPKDMTREHIEPPRPWAELDGRTNPNLAHTLYDFESKLPADVTLKGLQEAKNPAPMPPVKPAKREGTKAEFRPLMWSKEVEEKEVGLKFDQDKPDFSLLPMNTLTGIVKVLGFGAKKYGRENWKLLDDAKNRYSAALLRHFTAWQSGEKVDEESGMNHLYHMGCCLLFLIWGEENERN